MWTLQYFDAANNLQELGFAQLAALEGGRVVADAWQARFLSQRASSVSLRLPGVPPAVAPAIPFESRITLWSGRTLTAGVYSGGVRQFQGLRTDRSGTADPRGAGSSYVFEDEWYFLDHCPFQQAWVRLAAAGGPPNYVPFSSVVLFQPNPGQTYVPAPVNGLIHTGQQIRDILNWAVSLGASLQVGQIDPALYQAWYPLPNVKCGDAIRHCLRLHPDCFTELDYSTTPPTFNVRQRANLTAVNLPYAATDSSGRRHLATGIQPRPELQPRRVAIFYRVISNQYLLASPVDIYPNTSLAVTGPVITGQSVGGPSAPYTAGGSPVVGTAMSGITGNATLTIPVGAPGGLRALDFAVDLQGPQLAVSTAAITTAPFDPTNLAWWRQKVPALAQGIPASGPGALQLLSTTVNGGGPTDISVLDASTLDAYGNLSHPVNLATFTSELLPQSAPMAWMTASSGGPLQVLEVTVSAHFSYARQKNVGSGTLVIARPNDHVHSVRVKLCNSASVSGSYSQYLTTGEAIPANLAQSVYASLATLQYSFTHSLVERPFNGWLKPGRHAINLTGGAPAWSNMQATLARSEFRMHLDAAGVAFDHFTVQCGPVEHLEPGQLVQLFNTFANRDLARIDTGERLTGIPAPNRTVPMPADAARENTVTGLPDQALQVFSAPDAANPAATVAISHNPAAGQITVAQLDSSSGAQLNQRLVMAEYSGVGAPGPATLA
jgi:hypothetical protein